MNSEKMAKDINSKRLLYDRIAEHVMAILTAASLLLVLAMTIGLLLKSLPILEEHSLWDLLTEGEWRPMNNKFGFFPFLMGTLYVSLLALGIAIPISLLMAVFLTEYAHSSVKRYVFPFLDILAGFPSVIYGVWGMLVIVPWVADKVAPWVHRESSGYTVLATGIVLGVTVIPLLVSLFIEIFSNVGRSLPVVNPCTFSRKIYWGFLVSHILIMSANKVPLASNSPSLLPAVENG